MSAPTQFELEEALTCQCGCGLTVHACNHLQCPSGIPLKAEIASQIALGKTHGEILGHFATRYGEKILSAPTTTGFNLVAWVTPFAVVLIAALLIVVVVRRWRRPAPVVPAAPAAATPGDAEETRRRARLQRELERFDA